MLRYWGSGGGGGGIVELHPGMHRGKIVGGGGVSFAKQAI